MTKLYKTGCREMCRRPERDHRLERASGPRPYRRYLGHIFDGGLFIGPETSGHKGKQDQQRPSSPRQRAAIAALFDFSVAISVYC